MQIWYFIWILFEIENSEQKGSIFQIDMILDNLQFAILVHSFMVLKKLKSENLKVI